MQNYGFLYHFGVNGLYVFFQIYVGFNPDLFCSVKFVGINSGTIFVGINRAPRGIAPRCRNRHAF